MKVKEVADLIGTSVRTLHYYDEIGLLKPNEMTDAGYRIYSTENLERLQQILFYRELGFPLKKINEILNFSEFDYDKTLELQQKMLLKKRDRLDQMIVTIEKTIQHAKGKIIMSNEDRFVGFDFSQNPYEREARERWGEKSVDEVNSKIGQNNFEEVFNTTFQELARIRHVSPDSNLAQIAIEEWFEVLNKLGNYSLEAFKGLGQMYVDDERFTKNIDQFGEGLAKFMCSAMAHYADSNKKGSEGE